MRASGRTSVAPSLYALLDAEPEANRQRVKQKQYPRERREALLTDERRGDKLW